MVAPEYQPEEGRDEEHGDVVDEETEVHSLLLAVVVGDEQYGFYMFHEAA